MKYYRYAPSENSKSLAFTRTVTSADVKSLAGVPRTSTVKQFEKEDTARFDNKILQAARGHMSVSLASVAAGGSASPNTTLNTRILSGRNRRYVITCKLVLGFNIEVHGHEPRTHKRSRSQRFPGSLMKGKIPIETAIWPSGEEGDISCILI